MAAQQTLAGHVRFTVFMVFMMYRPYNNLWAEHPFVFIVSRDRPSIRSSNNHLTMPTITWCTACGLCGKEGPVFSGFPLHRHAHQACSDKLTYEITTYRGF
jgi:hypothetical protein